MQLGLKPEPEQACRYSAMLAPNISQRAKGRDAMGDAERRGEERVYDLDNEQVPLNHQLHL